MEPTSEEMQVSPEMQKRHMLGKLVMIVLGVVVIVAAAFAIWMYGNRMATVGETTQEIAPGQMMTTAIEGKIVSGFPEGLISEEGFEIIQSYRIEYENDGVSQPFLKYGSKWNIAENVAAFRESLSQGAWAVSRDGNPEETPATFFHAARENEEVNIVISQTQDGTVEVSIIHALNS